MVDDESDMLSFISTVLEDNCVAEFTASNSTDALKTAKLIIPDLITLDISMPVMNRGEVFQEFRKNSELKNIPVCIILGKPDLRRLIYIWSVPHPEEYMDKPINEKSLLQTSENINLCLA
jgi:CheY-like chemotaxis protein